MAATASLPLHDAPASPPPERAEQEQALRRRLGIPDEARQVLILGETSHWDPNWLRTSEEYYETRIEAILDEVLRQLTDEPRRVFSVESLFFLSLYYQRQPRQRTRLCQLLEEGRLRLTGTGMTTPDTVLPETEAILRDYLHGQEWLREIGVTVEPRLAYFPDTFGHSPALPSILEALGITQAGITRIDGMYFVATDFRRRSAFPLPGSSAHLLQEELQTTDFVWRGPDGAEVLCHWNAFGYFQGDMVAHRGIIRWMGLVAGIPWRTCRGIGRRLAGFVNQLSPLARTPYLFCPIGCDFVGPIPGLGALLDRYNERRFPTTGVYALSAGLDDYLDLVGCHRQRLPTLSLDPNPYWMGFYASRPSLKRRCNHVTHALIRAETLAARLPEMPAALVRDTRAAWSHVVLSNHHDFITGTSPDRIVAAEQEPWLDNAEALTSQATREVAERLTPPAAPAATPPSWTLEQGRLRVTTPHYHLVLSEERGGCLEHLAAADGAPLLAGPGNDLVAYRDTGGLWRLGHEYRGGSLTQVATASVAPATVQAHERDGLLEVRVVSRLAGQDVIRWLWLRGDSPVIRCRVEGPVSPRHTVLCRFPTRLQGSELLMDVPGGVVRRPGRTLFEPTFWAARSFALLRDTEAPRGLAVFLGGPAAVSLLGPGDLGWIAQRHAVRERAFRVLPLLSHPVGGSDPGPQRYDYAVRLTGREVPPWELAVAARELVRGEAVTPGAPDLWRLAAATVTSDRPDVMVDAVKPAHRGPGLVVRLRSWAHGPGSGAPAEERVVAHLATAPHRVQAAWRCDARERDQERLEVVEGVVAVPVTRALTSVRLVLDQGAPMTIVAPGSCHE